MAKIALRLLMLRAAQENKAGGVIYLGTHQTALAKAADVCLPVAAWAEQNGLFANAEGRVQEAKAATQPPMQAKEAWKVYRALSEELSASLPWNTQAQLRSVMAAVHPAYAEAVRGIVQPRAITLPKPTGNLAKAKLNAAVDTYYTRTTYLMQSAEMAAMQAEVGAARLQKEAA